MDNQDKSSWCKKGELDEVYFIKHVAPTCGLELVIHPDKQANKYATDMQLANGLMDADLKHVEHPFYKSDLYGYEAQHTVTLNHKDYLRYMNKYPEWGKDMAIIFWVSWPAATKFDVNVQSVSGVWSLRLHTLDKWIRNGRLRSHEYLQRKGGSGTNARFSWLIDLRMCNRHERRSDV